jgi:hypothetical protein
MVVFTVPDVHIAVRNLILACLVEVYLMALSLYRISTSNAAPATWLHQKMIRTNLWNY